MARFGFPLRTSRMMRPSPLPTAFFTPWGEGTGEGQELAMASGDQSSRRCGHLPLTPS
jgi:hypothetical protein